jgi:hypothetical protein
MRSAIAIIMAILGVILVLGGAGALWAAAVAGSDRAEDPTRTGWQRTVDVASKVPTPERLIVWGVVLLALGAVAAGAISLSVSVTAGGG